LLAGPQSGKHGLDDKQREITERLYELAVEETRPDANIRLGMSRAMADTGKLCLFPSLAFFSRATVVTQTQHLRVLLCALCDICF
jgi:hypothetical protein